VTEEQVRRHIDRWVWLTWRDPQGYAGWQDEPLTLRALRATQPVRVLGINGEGDAVVAGCIDEDGTPSNVDVMPCGCVESIRRMKGAPKR